MEKNPDIQFRSPEEIKLYQETRLAETLSYLQAHSLFYQQMFREHSIDIARIKKIEDLQQIPEPPKQTCNCITRSSSVWTEMPSSTM